MDSTIRPKVSSLYGLFPDEIQAKILPLVDEISLITLYEAQNYDKILIDMTPVLNLSDTFARKCPKYNPGHCWPHLNLNTERLKIAGAIDQVFEALNLYEFVSIRTFTGDFDLVTKLLEHSKKPFISIATLFRKEPVSEEYDAFLDSLKNSKILTFSTHSPPKIHVSKFADALATLKIRELDIAIRTLDGGMAHDLARALKFSSATKLKLRFLGDIDIEKAIEPLFRAIRDSKISRLSVYGNGIQDCVQVFARSVAENILRNPRILLFSLYSVEGKINNRGFDWRV